MSKIESISNGNRFNKVKDRKIILIQRKNHIREHIKASQEIEQ
jgi:hypothetical protein